MTDEAESIRARLQWRTRFRARVEAMAKLLDPVPEDNTPTPNAAEDGERK